MRDLVDVIATNAVQCNKTNLVKNVEVIQVALVEDQLQKAGQRIDID